MLPTTDIVAWARLLKSVRAFFDSRGYLEVTTPALVNAGAFESTLDTLKVAWEGGRGELQTSPEIEMKKLLAREKRSIYQICPSFRDDPLTDVHLKEFCVLEFYRVEACWKNVKEEMGELIKDLSVVSPPMEDISFMELMRRYAEVDLEKCDSKEKLLRHLPILASSEDSWEDLVFKLLVEKVEPALDPACVTFVYDYPASMAALARVGAGGFAERFEIYWQGMEICNGASELSNEQELRARYLEESQKRVAVGKRPHPEPQDLFEALRTLPVCAGVAVGLNRLARALAISGGARTIDA